LCDKNTTVQAVENAQKVDFNTEFLTEITLRF